VPPWRLLPSSPRLRPSQWSEPGGTHEEAGRGKRLWDRRKELRDDCRGWSTREALNGRQHRGHLPRPREAGALPTKPVRHSARQHQVPRPVREPVLREAVSASAGSPTAGTRRTPSVVWPRQGAACLREVATASLDRGSGLVRRRREVDASEGEGSAGEAESVPLSFVTDHSRH
jgi:hypothetical protein